MEEGLVPICFEKLGCVGGLWSYTRTSAIDRVCVHLCAISNTSKEMTYVSESPIPKPVFLPSKLVLKYLQNYAEEFGILDPKE